MSEQAVHTEPKGFKWLIFWEFFLLFSFVFIYRSVKIDGLNSKLVSACWDVILITSGQHRSETQPMRN
jgi:hypothetical protein